MTENSPMDELLKDADVFDHCFKDASSDTYGKMTKELTGIYGNILGVALDHTYIRYFGSEDWGWNGSNF